MYYYFLSFVFILCWNNMAYSQQGYDKTSNDFEEGKEANPKKQDLEMKYVNYLSKLLEQKVIGVNDIKKHADEIEMGVFNNPIQCPKGKCDTTKLIHFKEIENYKKNINKMSFKILSKYLNKILYELDELNSKKQKSEKSNEFLEIPVEFVKIEKGGEYVIFREFEKIELPFTDTNFFINFIDYFNIGDENKRKIYRFKRFKLNEDFEVSANLISQYFFAEIMGYNPSYEGVSEDNVSNKMHLNDVKIKDKVVKLKNRVAVSNMSLKQLNEFINKLNNSNHPLVLKMNNGKKCKYDIIKQEHYDYLKYYYFKEFSIYDGEKIQDLLFSREATHDLYKNFDISSSYFRIFFGPNKSNIELVHNNIKEIEEWYTFDKDSISSILNPEYREFRLNYNHNYLEINGNRIYDVFFNKLIFVQKNDKVCLDGVPLLRYRESTNYFLTYSLFGYLFDFSPRAWFKDGQNQQNSCLLFKDLNKVLAVLKHSKKIGANEDSSFYTGIRLTRKCED